jgi:hypothetical protein
LTIKYLILSIAAHAVAVFLFYFSFPAKVNPPSPELEVVEWTPPAPAPQSKTAAAPGADKRKGEKAKGSGKDNLSMKDLGISWDTGEGVSVPTGSGQSLGVDHGDGGAGSGVLGKIKHAGRFRTLYESLDAALEYPRELVDREIEGVVTATLVFSPDGSFQKGQSKVNASSRFLKVVVFRLLRRVFDPRSPKMPRWRESNEMVVHCTFEFRLRSGDVELSNKNQVVDRKMLGNKFYFTRFGNLSGSWKLGPLQGYSVMPSIGLDTDWLVDQVTPKKDSGDPLDNYRHDPDWGS